MSLQELDCKKDVKYGKKEENLVLLTLFPGNNQPLTLSLRYIDVTAHVSASRTPPLQFKKKAKEKDIGFGQCGVWKLEDAD